MSTQTQSPFTVLISKDGLCATIQAAKGAELSDVTPADILAALEAAKVVVDDQVTRPVQEYVEALRSPDGPPEGEFQIAAGRPPTEAKDGMFTWADALQEQATEWCNDAPVDFYNTSSIVTVEAGTVIGRIGPPTPGTNGVDVRGNLLSPSRQPREVTLKNGVELGEDGVSVIATVAGKVVYKDQELLICEVVEVAGNVDFETGNLDVTTDVVVRRTVQDLFSVKTTKNLTVWGVIEAATIEVDGDVTVRDGIVSREKGQVVAGGEIRAKYCDLANLRAGGDICVAREVVNSHVHTEGKLVVPRGAVLGGRVYARRGVEIDTLGSDAGVSTEIAIGLHFEEIRRIREAPEENGKRRAAVDKIRQTVGPLMTHVKRLSNEQREKATELMYQADSLEMEIKESEAEIAALRASDSDQSQPCVLVSARIYRGVSISISGRAVTFHEELKGPVKIQRREIKNQTVIVAVNQITASVTELKNYRP